MELMSVCSTPLCLLLWLHHMVRSLVRRWSSELRATFLIKVICPVAIFFLVLGISKNFFLTVSFAICCYFTSVIFMTSMHRMLQCRNTSIF